MKETLLRNLNISALTPMQEAMAQAYGSSDNIVLLSPTGTGKTLAYLLPLVAGIDPARAGVQAVVITPSRELALQSEGVCRQMRLPFAAMCCYGGRPAMDEHRTMNGLRPAILFGTPGRINDHLGKQNFDPRTVTTLVIDEFDKCLELGFREEMAQVISRLPGVRKRILLSATDSEEIPRFALADSVPMVKLDFLGEGVGDRLCLYTVASPVKDKLVTLHRLLCTLGEAQTLVFVNHRESADRVAGYLLAQRFPCDAFHGGMEQDLRERALYRFRCGACPVLVCTDLAARGLDIRGVDCVVHYHLPVGPEAFTHRNGRTARWDAQGRVYLIVHPEEVLPDYVGHVHPLSLPERVPPAPRPAWATIYIGRGKKDKLSKGDICGFFCKTGGLAKDDVGMIDVRDHHSYVAVRRNKVKQLLTLVEGEKIKGMRTVVEEAK